MIQSCQVLDESHSVEDVDNDDDDGGMTILIINDDDDDALEGITG